MPHACSIRWKEWYEKNKEKIREQQKKYREENIEKYREYQKEGIKDLSDSYVKGLLTDRTTLTYEDIPQELIEAKRELIKINRFIKKENQK